MFVSLTWQGCDGKGSRDLQKAFQNMHQTFMKNTSLTEESRDVRFIASDVAVVTTIVRAVPLSS